MAESEQDNMTSATVKAKASLRQRLRRTLVAGLSVIAPLWITGFVLLKLFQWAAGFSRPLIKPFAAALGNPEWYNPAAGFVLTLLIVLLVGVMTTRVFGRRLLRNGREALERLPIVRTIYAPIRRLMETMTSSEGAGFKKVVLFEYPRRGLWTLGFLAGDVPFENGGSPAHSVFIPTAPNPTTGFMLIIPQGEMKHTSLTVEEAFQMIVSAGVAVPLTLKLPSEVGTAGGGVNESAEIDAEVIERSAAAQPDPQ
jgi:uncharacterized membrane protein